MALLVWSLEQSLRHSSFLSGYLLMGSFVVLTGLGIRKRLSFLPLLGSTHFWMQVHLYVGLATFAMFALHVGWRIPDGWLETSLTALFLIVGGSGIYGAVITRRYPAKLTSRGGEVIFEQIPLLRAQLAGRARTLILQSNLNTDVLGRFYVNHLVDFLERPRDFGLLLAPSGHRKRQLVADISDLDRYLSEDQRKIGRELSELVEQRDQLDYHYALQGRLKVWLFVHIGFTYSLLLLSMLHLILVHAFRGGLA